MKWATWRKRRPEQPDTSEWDQLDWISHDIKERDREELNKMKRASAEFWLMKAGFAAAIAHLIWDVMTDILRWCGITD